MRPAAACRDPSDHDEVVAQLSNVRSSGGLVGLGRKCVIR